jgi:hypothetical protein
MEEKNEESIIFQINRNDEEEIREDISKSTNEIIGDATPQESKV